MFRLLVGLLGVTSLLVSASLLFGGGSLLWVDTAFTDAEGFVNSVPVEIEVDGYALVAGPAEIDIEPDLPIEVGELATIRLRAESQSASQEIFLGVAEASAVEAFLGGATYAVIDEFAEDSFEWSYKASESEQAPAAPTTVDIWMISTYGTGEQVLDWEVRSGDVSFVVMNERATEGMAFEASVGARVPLVKPLGVGLLIGGGVTLALGTILLAIAL